MKSTREAGEVGALEPEAEVGFKSESHFLGELREQPSLGAPGDPALSIEGPSHYPLACGALGRYDDGQVRRIQRALGQGLSTVHRDETSILLVDRPPASWRHGLTRGFAWSEAAPGDSSRVTSWRDAATELAACGLVLEGGGAYLHSSVAGVAPVYYLEEGEATYFASRIDPLVQACVGKLSIDWAAWAAIFLLKAPLGDGTPFLEVRRLRPFSVLEHRPHDGARQIVHEWPWARHDPGAGDGTEEIVVENIRRAIRALPAEPFTCPLSGGWDSRLLLALLRERADLPVSALTLRRTFGGHREEGYARAVASNLSVPLTEVAARRWRSRGDADEVARRTEYQTTHHGWYMPIARGLRSAGRPAVDGLAGDIFFRISNIVTEEMLDSPWERAVSALWVRLSNEGYVPDILSDRLGAAFTALAWRQWHQEAGSFAHHPAGLTLTVYTTRTLRGIAPCAESVLGADSRIFTPCTDDGVVRAALALPERPRVTEDAYRRMFQLINPVVGQLPSTHDSRPETAPRAQRPPRRELQGYARHLRRNPLGGEIRNDVVTSDDRLAGLLGVSKASHLLRSLVLLSQWHRRYEEKLREVDPGEILG